MTDSSKKRNTILIILASVLVVALIAVVAFVLMGQSDHENELPASSIEGYYSLNQKYYGGKESQDKEVNLYSINIDNSPDTSTIRFDFLRGSMYDDDSKDLNSLPSYEVMGLASPNRLVVKFSNLTFWEYEDTYSALSSQGNIIEIFRPYTSSLNEDGKQEIYIFIQLNNDVGYKVTEEDGSLLVEMKNTNYTESTSSYYVTSNLYYDWENMIGALYPTFVEDKSRQILISSPYKTEQEAMDYLTQMETKYNELNLISDLKVIELEYNTLPTYNPGELNALLEQSQVISVEGEGKTLPLLMSEGEFLASTADGSKMLFSNVVYDQTNDEYKPELWITQLGGTPTKLDIPNLVSVDYAGFSDDGSKIALLNNIGTSSLEVFDINTKEFINLGEEGIGNSVSSFDWEGNLLYIVAGDNGAYQLKTYDFSKPFGDRISVVVETPLDINGTFNYAGENAYYSSGGAGGYDGAIFKVDGKTGSVSEITKGVDFAVSEDNKYLLIKDITQASAISGIGEEEEVNENSPIFGLKLLNLETNEETRVVSNVFIDSFDFSSDGAKVFYTTSDSQEEIYSYKLNSYTVGDGEMEEVGDLKWGQFYVTTEKNTVLVVDFINNQFVTYVLDINNLN